MNANQFLEIIQHSNALQRDEISHLLELHETFPYFQIPKVLLAKYEFEQNIGKQDFLHWAAITSPDRNWLRSLLETEAPLAVLRKELVQKKQEKECISSAKKAMDLSDESFDVGKSLLSDQITEDKSKEKTEVVKRLDDPLINLQTDLKGGIEEGRLSKGRPIVKDEEDEFIEYLKKKEKKEIVDEKQKIQIDLIKSFSKREFKLASLKEMENSQQQDDLSRKSTELNSNLISESFALILLNQGKKQKAKEIYQKLMVKFPEKSVYFTELLKTLEDKN